MTSILRNSHLTNCDTTFGSKIQFYLEFIGKENQNMTDNFGRDFENETISVSFPRATTRKTEVGVWALIRYEAFGLMLGKRWWLKLTSRVCKVP